MGLGWGPGETRRTFGENHWNEPLRWNRRAAKDGVMRRVFAFSMADIFDEEAPAGELNKLWPLIDATEHLIWLLLTKRPNGYLSKMPSRFLNHPRVWKGVTCEDQKWYRFRWPKMYDGGVNWISYEPALGPLDLNLYPWPEWVVCGGESGNHSREMLKKWALKLRGQCAERKIPFFMKQMSARTPAIGKSLIPAELHVQEFPA
jgi:protein gp37